MNGANKLKPIDGQGFRDVMRLFPTGVGVLFADHGGDWLGMTANALSSISLDPPLIMVSVGNGRRMIRNLDASDHFSISFLSSAQAAIGDRYSGRPSHPSTQLDMREHALGVPVAKDGLGWVVCKKHRRIAAGDHTIVLGLVLDAVRRGGSPLVFHEGRWKSLEEDLRI